MKRKIVLFTYLASSLISLSSCSNKVSPNDEFELIKGNTYHLKGDSSHSLTFSNDTNNWEISYKFTVDNKIYNGTRMFTLEQVFDQDKIPSESNVNLSDCRAYLISFEPRAFTGIDGKCDRSDFAWFMDGTSDGYRFLFHYQNELLSPTKKKIFLANYCSTLIGLTPNVESKYFGNNAIFY